jgi:hypothetical protein
MAYSFELIEAKTLGSNTNVVTFSSIPNTYTDLLLKASTRQSGDADGYQMGIRFNGSSASEYSRRLLYSWGSGVGTGGAASENFARVAFAESSTYAANTFNNIEIYIPNYTSSNYKSFSTDAINEDNATTVYAQSFYAGIWSNTATITSLSISEYSGSGTDFVTNSTFYLYGIKNS